MSNFLYFNRKKYLVLELNRKLETINEAVNELDCPKKYVPYFIR